MQTKTWAKRLGIGAFLFFTIKGLLWLIIPGVVIGVASCRGEKETSAEVSP